MSVEIVPVKQSKTILFLEGNVLRDEAGLVAWEVLSRNANAVQLVKNFDAASDEMAMIPSAIVARWFGGVRIQGNTIMNAATKRKLNMSIDTRLIESERVEHITMENGGIIKVTGSCRYNGKRAFKGIRLGMLVHK